MKYSLESQRARIENIRFAEQNAAGCSRKERIRNYMPGQVTYSLGDYPQPISAMPTEYDHQLLRTLAERGVEMIQVHEEWNDAMLLYGADKYTPQDPEGMKRFVELCHENGIRIIPYISSGYLQPKAADFQEAFCHTNYTYDGVILHYRKGSADSAAWRSFIIPKALEVIDRYGFDGIYNDWGYDGLNKMIYKQRDAGLPFDRHAMEYDPYIEDLLCIFYEEVHRRGGVYKLHDDSTHGVYHERAYDYLWIGEGETDAKKTLLYKDSPLYIVPCPDKRYLPRDNPRYYYALTIPFVQFPLLTHGRPWTGMGMCHPTFPYETRYSAYTKRMAVSEFCRSHPNGPYVYSHWSSLPDDPGELDYWSGMLSLYKPMVTEGSIVHMDIRESPMFRESLSADTFATLFTNEEQYLVVSNLGEVPVTVTLADAWLDRESGEHVQTLCIAPKDFRFLKRI
ncbi:MAG: hypothetical protein E7463_05320 [Ruminococcaceae bacterium]|nr:hypothetical protein [Oscillospiraceae bacterium]